MHGHDSLAPEWFAQAASAIEVVGVGLFIAMVLFYLGVLPIPVGYDRGKVAFVMWCGTGTHAHRVYWWGGEDGFQSLHPAEYTGGDD